jgi:CheY-like chemotaxis protein
MEAAHNLREMWGTKMQSMRILVLGPEGTGRNALEETLTRLGYVVMGAEARADRPTPASGDVVMLDLRDEGADWQPMADALHADQRPMMIICDRPRRLVRTLSGRPAGTMLLTGAESDAGYKVALTVAQALRRTAVCRATDQREDDSEIHLAAL